MGLDMTLYGAKYYFDEKDRTSHITLDEVACWRKQNAIHNWIVINVQNSVDNCAMYVVMMDQLKELLSLCKEVLANPTAKNAMEVLPTQSGFFFGGTDLNKELELKYYLNGLKYTVEVIEELFNKDFDFFVYESSW